MQIKDDVFRKLADRFPMRENQFCIMKVYDWLENDFLDDAEMFFTDRLVELIEARAVREGFLLDTEADGFFRRATVLFTPKQIHERVKQLADEFARDFSNEPLTIIGILNGCAPFMIDLIAAFPEPMRQHVIYGTLQASSRNGMESTGEVKILRDPSVDIEGRNVLIVEGIVGTGLTLHTVVPRLKKRNPKAIKVCALLDKKARRIYDVPVDYYGFEAPDEFVIGYGLDLNQQYRWLPFIGYFDQKENE